ncbi:hypothetical protein GWK47_013581 [Chionoecetes opilio]|uniref:Uncharacterized protein n=1 Tax=Chionoecetes opilio TaxID=41210 RepID=A0A8J4Y4G3_CHIOP|nr:hypothetical protein GWK47_013581 [Chionoecetes opilio]
MDEDDWEELDENAMEECMVLATQLCSQRPQGQGTANGHNNTHHIQKLPASKNSHESEAKKLSGVISNGSLNHLRDSGVCSTRSSSANQSVNDATSSTRNQRRDIQNTGYMSRFSDFSGRSSSLHQNTSARKPTSRSAGVVLSTSASRGSPSKVKSPAKLRSGGDAFAGNHLLVKKAEEEKAKLDERILVMQGEISLLRSELKRKETVLETERLDHCAAIEAAEKKGREKKREIEELLQRCHRLEQQPQALQASQTAGPPNKRPRLDKTSALFAKDADSSLTSRFDFSCRAVKVSVEVQTESESPQLKNVPRRRLAVASPRGQVCQTRSIATLLSCGAVAVHQHTPSATPIASPSPLSSDSCGSAGWSLPSEWLSIISGALREDKSVECKLVTMAVERLQQTRITVSDKDGDQCRLMQYPSDPTAWYERQVGPAIQILLYFKSSSEPSVLQAITAHLSPIKIKDDIVNRRIRSKLLEATEKISRTGKLHIEGNSREALVLALRDCCGSLEHGGEAGTLLRVAAALAPHCQLCVSSEVCLISQLCKKVKKLCVPGVDTLRALLDWTWANVKITSPSIWLNSSCPCSSHLLGTFIWHIYQALEAPHHTDKSKVYRVLVSCIEVLHHWSTVDPDWWGKVSPFPQYPALMAAIAAKSNDIKFDRETIDLLCDLCEFEGGLFRR